LPFWNGGNRGSIKKFLNSSFHIKRKEDIMEKTIEEEDSIGRADQGKRKG